MATNNVAILKEISSTNYLLRHDVYTPTIYHSGYITNLVLTVNIKSIPAANFPYIPDDTPPDVLEKILEQVAAEAQFKEIRLLLKKGAGSPWIEKATIRIFNKEPYYEIDLMPYFSNANTIDVASDLAIGIQVKLGNVLGESDKIVIFGTAVEEMGNANTSEEEMGSRIIGEIISFGGASAPSGWLVCDGSERPIDGYQRLYEVLGLSWGPLTNGMGVAGGSHFRLPDLRGRSLIGAGTGNGLSARMIGEMVGAEAHTLTPTEMPSHTHVQDSHNHTQSAHNHTQSAHNHVQDAHNHVQNAHGHTYNWFTGANAASSLTATGGVLTPTANAATTSNVAATNIAATATNQVTTATNQVTTATNIAATATNQSTGGGSAHNNMQPSAVVYFLIYAG